jgi:hypothetical protein
MGGAWEVVWAAWEAEWPRLLPLPPLSSWHKAATVMVWWLCMMTQQRRNACRPLDGSDVRAVECGWQP